MFDIITAAVVILFAVVLLMHARMLDKLSQRLKASEQAHRQLRSRLVNIGVLPTQEQLLTAYASLEATKPARTGKIIL